MDTPDSELVVRIADSLEEDESLGRSMRELKLLPRFVRPAVQARFVHQLCETPPLSDMADVVAQARARCAERIEDLSVTPGATVAYPLQWDMSIEVDGEQVGQAQIHLDIEFDALELWRSLGTAPRAGGTEDVLAQVSLSVSVGESALATATASLQFGPWSYPG